jgi:hypothetical protein
MKKESVYLIILILVLVMGVVFSGILGNFNNTPTNASINKSHPNNTTTTTTNHTDNAKIGNKHLTTSNNTIDNHNKNNSGCKDGVCPINGH